MGVKLLFPPAASLMISVRVIRAGICSPQCTRSNPGVILQEPARLWSCVSLMSPITGHCLGTLVIDGGNKI